MMRWQLVLVGVVTLTMTACQKTEQPTAYSSEPYEPLPMESTSTDDDLFASEVYSDDPYATDPLVTRQEPTVRRTEPKAKEEVVVAADQGTTVGLRTHVVRKGDTLYKLARVYYNDQSKWRAIWDANRDKVSDPDVLSVGQTLVIP
jgi:nucleoid-associated protein YgaU